MNWEGPFQPRLLCDSMKCLHDALGTRREGRNKDRRSSTGGEGAYGSDLVSGVQWEGGRGHPDRDVDSRPTEHAKIPRMQEQ